MKTTGMYSTNMQVIWMVKQQGVHHVLCPQMMCQIQDQLQLLNGGLSPGQTSTHLWTLSKHTSHLGNTRPDAYFFLPIPAEAYCRLMVIFPSHSMLLNPQQMLSNISPGTDKAPIPTLSFLQPFHFKTTYGCAHHTNSTTYTL